MIGSFYFVRKWKVYLALFSASAPCYKYSRKRKLLVLEILVINLNGIKRHLTYEKPMTFGGLLQNH